MDPKDMTVRTAYEKVRIAPRGKSKIGTDPTDQIVAEHTKSPLDVR